MAGSSPGNDWDHVHWDSNDSDSGEALLTLKTFSPYWMKVVTTPQVKFLTPGDCNHITRDNGDTKWNCPICLIQKVIRLCKMGCSRKI